MKHIDFRHFVNKLTTGHREALKWFKSMANKDKQYFYQHVPDTKISLFSAEAGLYKPKESNYILSLKETTSKKRTHSHRHIEPFSLNDGSTIYLYHHEINTEKLSAQERAMQRNIKEEIPIGIAVEVPSPDSKLRYDYKLGFVYGHYKNYYIIQCVNSELKISNDWSNKSLEDIYQKVLKE